MPILHAFLILTELVYATTTLPHGTPSLAMRLRRGSIARAAYPDGCECLPNKYVCPWPRSGTFRCLTYIDVCDKITGVVILEAPVRTGSLTITSQADVVNLLGATVTVVGDITINAPGQDITFDALRRVKGVFTILAANRVDAQHVEALYDLSIRGATAVDFRSLRRICGGGVLARGSAITALHLPAFEGGHLTRLFIDFQEVTGCAFSITVPPRTIGHPSLDSDPEGGVYLDVSDTFVADWPELVDCTGPVRFARALTVNFPNLMRAGGMGIEVLGTVRDLMLPRLATFVAPLAGIRLGSSRLLALHLPSYDGGPLSRLVLSFAGAVAGEFSLGQSPTLVGHSSYNYQGALGGLLVDVSDSFVADWPALQLTGGMITVYRAHTLRLHGITEVGWWGLEILGSCAVLELPNLARFTHVYSGVYINAPRLMELLLPAYDGGKLSRFYVVMATGANGRLKLPPPVAVGGSADGHGTGGLVIDVGDDVNLTWPTTTMTGGQININRAYSVDLSNVTITGGDGLWLTGTVAVFTAPRLASISSIYLGSNTRLRRLLLPAYTTAPLAKLRVDFADNIVGEFQLGQPPGPVGIGGIFLDVSRTFDALWPTLQANGGELTLKRVRAVDLTGLQTVGPAGVDVNSPHLVGNFTLPLLTGTSGMKLSISVGENCTAVSLGSLGGGGGAALPTVAELVVEKSAAFGSFVIDVGSGGGGPREVTRHFQFGCIGGCRVTEPVHGLSALVKLSGAWPQHNYIIQGFAVTGGRLFDRDMATVQLTNAKRMAIQNTSGVASFVPGVASPAWVASDQLNVHYNADLTKLCPIVGGPFAQVSVTNNPLLPTTCESGHGAACFQCTNNGGGAGPCSCP